MTIRIAVDVMGGDNGPARDRAKAQWPEPVARREVSSSWE